MGHNGTWISRNASEPRNASSAEAAGANRSALGEFGEAQLYRQFTTAVQVVIFIGSLLEIAKATSTFSSHHPDQSAAINMEARSLISKILCLVEDSDDG